MEGSGHRTDLEGRSVGLTAMFRSFLTLAAQMLVDIFLTLTHEFGLKRSSSLGMTGVSCLGSTLLATGKLLIGILSLSFFTCVNAFYSYGMVAAKIVALAGVVRERDRRGQYRYCRLAALILMGASLCYLVYTLYLYRHPSQYRYFKIFAIGIAAYAFIELGINLWGVIRERRRGLPLFQTIKTLNLCSALMSLVLTQRAILSLSFPPERTAGINALFGALMALLATLLGACLFRQMYRLETCAAYRRPFRRLRKLMVRRKLYLDLRPVYYIENGSRCYLGVHIRGERDRFPDLCREAENTLNLCVLDADAQCPSEVLSALA